MEVEALGRGCKLELGVYCSSSVGFTVGSDGTREDNLRGSDILKHLIDPRFCARAAMYKCVFSLESIIPNWLSTNFEIIWMNGIIVFGRLIDCLELS